MDIESLSGQFQSHVQGLSGLGINFPARGMVNIRGLMRPASLVQHQMDEGVSTRGSDLTDIVIPHEQGIVPHSVTVTRKGDDVSSMIYRPASSEPEHHMLYDPKNRIQSVFTDRVGSPDEFLDRLPEKMGSYDPMGMEEAHRRGYGRQEMSPYGGRHLVEDWSTYSHDSSDRYRGIESYLTDPDPVNLERIPDEERN